MPGPGATGAPAGGGTAGLMVADSWTFSETTSPVDYSPVVVATSWADEGRTILLSLQCRGGRSELAIGGPAVVRAPQDYALSYAVNEAEPVTAVAVASTSGNGISMRTDVARFLATLPDEGAITFRLVSRQGEALAARYSLPSVKKVGARLSRSCKGS